jgi:CRP-like cAMP-binding protein
MSEGSRISRSSLLPLLEPTERPLAARLLASCATLALHPGELAGSADLPATGLIVVERGVAATVCSHTAQPDKRMVLSISGRGAMLPPLLGEERLAALTAARATLVSPEAMRGLLALPSAAHAITLALLETIQDGHESLAQLGDAPHCDRLREKLLQLARRHGRVVPDGVRIDLPLTHELLAQTVRSARETVTLALGDLERDGFLARDGHSYRLRIPPESLAT